MVVCDQSYRDVFEGCTLPRQVPVKFAAPGATAHLSTACSQAPGLVDFSRSICGNLSLGDTEPPPPSSPLPGKERQDSVESGLKSIADSAQLVAVHDSARPLVTVKGALLSPFYVLCMCARRPALAAQLVRRPLLRRHAEISNVLADAMKHGAAVLGAPPSPFRSCTLCLHTLLLANSRVPVCGHDLTSVSPSHGTRLQACRPRRRSSRRSPINSLRRPSTARSCGRCTRHRRARQHDACRMALRLLRLRWSTDHTRLALTHA